MPRHLKNGGLVVRSLRDEAGWSQQDLANAIGPKWDRHRVSRLESGTLPMTVAAAEQIAEAFEMDLGRFYLECTKRLLSASSVEAEKFVEMMDALFE